MTSKELNKVRDLFNRRMSEMASVIFPATVTSVDEAARICSVCGDMGEYEGVRLFAVEEAGKKGLCVIPANGSQVLVGRIGGSNELFVAMTGEVSKVIVTLPGDVAAVVDGDGITARAGMATAIVTSGRITATHGANQIAVDAAGIKAQAGGMAFQITGGGIALGGEGGGLKDTLSALCRAISKLTVTIPGGTSGTPVNTAEFEAINEQLKRYLQ